MWPNSFRETMGDVEVKALVNTMHQSLTEVEGETPGDTLRDVEPEALADTLADRLAEVKAEKVDKTLTAIKSASQLSTH